MLLTNFDDRHNSVSTSGPRPHLPSTDRGLTHLCASRLLSWSYKITISLSEGRDRKPWSTCWSHQSSLPSVEIVCVSARTDTTSIIQEIEAPNPTSSNLYYVDRPCLNPRIKPHWYQKNSPPLRSKVILPPNSSSSSAKNTHGWLPTVIGIRRACLVSQGGFGAIFS